MSASRVTLDSNVLVYAFDAADAVKRAQAQTIIDAFARLDCPLALQTMGEFYAAVVRRSVLKPAEAARQVEHFLDVFDAFADSEAAHRTAAEAAAKARFSYWDAVLLASAAEQRCDMILSEDMHDGAKLGGIVVRNPFGAAGLSPAAKAALHL